MQQDYYTLSSYIEIASVDSLLNFLPHVSGSSLFWGLRNVLLLLRNRRRRRLYFPSLFGPDMHPH